MTTLGADAILIGFVLSIAALFAGWRRWDRRGTSRWVTIPTLVVALFVWFVAYPKLLT